MRLATKLRGASSPPPPAATIPSSAFLAAALLITSAGAFSPPTTAPSPPPAFAPSLRAPSSSSPTRSLLLLRAPPPPAASSSLVLSAGGPNADEGDAGGGRKETTWDRIAGPKLFKTVTNWSGVHSAPLVPLRILTGLLMVHHGSEGGVGPANLGTPEFQGFVDYIVKPYFSFLPGSADFWAAIHDYVEFVGGACVAFGFLTRPASLSLLVTMLSAVYFHLSSVGAQGFPLGHVPNYSYDFEEPLLYALIFALFWFNGAGPLSVDSVIYDRIKDEEDRED